MSSRVVMRAANQAAIQPMVWRPSTTDSPGAAAPSSRDGARFEPAISFDHENAALRNRLVETEQAARQAVDAARRQALAEGEAQGAARAQAAVEPVLAKLADSLDELARLRPRLREQAESDVVQLSLAIARRILHRELSVDPGAMRALVQVALERLERQEIQRVRIHPAQCAPLREIFAGRQSEIEIQPDPRLEPGGLIFETNRGKLDASVSAQLDEIERGLTDRVKNG